MVFTLVEGNNRKLFVQLSDVTTKEDIAFLETIKTTVSREEYMPFIKSFNKTISASYFYNDTFFPYQFWYDVRKQYINFFGTKPILVNEEIGYNVDLSREDFDSWIKNLQLPEKYILDSDEYKFQQDSAFEAIKHKIGHIEVGTSGGKTLITYFYCAYLKESGLLPKNKKILVIVPNKSLCIQLQKDFNEYASLREEKLIVETIYSGAEKFIDSDIVCGTYHSLREYEQEYFNSFFSCICDELHTAKAFSIKSEIFSKLRDYDYFVENFATFDKSNYKQFLADAIQTLNKLKAQNG